jgi:ABC-type uncharacterized transport system substrate-binding protein
MMRNLLRCSCRIGLVVLSAAGAASNAAAHPHVFVDARAEILFDAQGRMTRVRHVWEFDRAFSAYAALGLDTDGNGKLSGKELAPLAKINVNSLKAYAFFTFLTVGGDRLEFKFPDKYFLDENSGRLTLHYDLPLRTPTAPGANTTLEVFDPEYFVAFTFVKKSPITLSHAPRGCTAAYHPPKPLNAGIMAKLSVIPASQHDLPQALRDAAVGLANLITVSCPQ